MTGLLLPRHAILDISKKKWQLFRTSQPFLLDFKRSCPWTIFRSRPIKMQSLPARRCLFNRRDHSWRGFILLMVSTLVSNSLQSVYSEGFPGHGDRRRSVSRREQRVLHSVHQETQERSESSSPREAQQQAGFPQLLRRRCSADDKVQIIWKLAAQRGGSRKLVEGYATRG